MRDSGRAVDGMRHKRFIDAGQIAVSWRAKGGQQALRAAAGPQGAVRRPGRRALRNVHYVDRHFFFHHMGESGRTLPTWGSI